MGARGDGLFGFAGAARLGLLLLACACLWGASFKLYLRDGSFHVVREYKVEGERVRYYSIERSEWEELPLELVDLKRTTAEIQDREDSRREEAAMVAAEEKAEREARREIERVPMEKGVYFVAGEELKPLKQAESKVASNKRRSVLKAISPIPVVTGKANVEVDGERSAMAVTGERPEFYIRLHTEERFGIVRLSPGKGVRVVQKWTIVPVTKEIVEEQDAVEIFRRQVDEGLYKIWPIKPLAPGEYAVVEYTEGKGNIQIWDFSLQPGK